MARGKSGLRARGREADGDGLGDGVDETLEGDTRPQRDGQQNAEDEEGESNVHGGEEFQEREEDSPNRGVPTV